VRFIFAFVLSLTLQRRSRARRGRQLRKTETKAEEEGTCEEQYKVPRDKKDEPFKHEYCWGYFTRAS
jgi:hypothetical protein